MLGDLDGDGGEDLLINHWSLVQGQGLTWFESIDKAPCLVEHVIGADGELHGNGIGDINGDGKMELVTGKILFPHQGRDPGEFDPLLVFWYEIQDGKFEGHILSYDHLQRYPDATGNPPPNNAIGLGRKMVIADVDKDGQLGIIAPSNTGLYIFYRRGTAPVRIIRNPCVA
jgi:hypothetical protein